MLRRMGQDSLMALRSMELTGLLSVRSAGSSLTRVVSSLRISMRSEKIWKSIYNAMGVVLPSMAKVLPSSPRLMSLRLRLKRSLGCSKRLRTRLEAVL